MRRECDDARGDFPGACAGLLITRQVGLDSGDISDRCRIRRTRADSCLPELAEHMCAICRVPDQNGETEIDGVASFNWPRNLDDLDSLAASAQIIGGAASNVVVG